jgi:phosphatidylglycerol:prolipoprotein diacylglycerol transferase
MNEFWLWWQRIPENLDPVIFQIGGFKLQYYGLMYIVAFAITYYLAVYRIKREDRFGISVEQFQNIMTAMVIGLLVGARLGYVVFYNLSYYVQHPLEIILPFSFSGGFHVTGIAGMSYHGGLIGAIVGACWSCRRAKLDQWTAGDLFIPGIPLGYTFGRLGNFINGELYGRVTESPIGMYFPLAAGLERRHPSQLYEAFFEGVFLFAILWTIKNSIRTRGATLSVYLFGYGFVRFVIEYYREPDAHIGFVVGAISMGQVLCVAMMAASVGLYFYLRKRGEHI